MATFQCAIQRIKKRQITLKVTPRIKGLGRTKTYDKAFAVLGGFWHSAA